MSTESDTDTPVIDLVSPEVFQTGHPWEQYRWLRRNAPVYRHEGVDGKPFWALTKYDDIRTVSRAPKLFSSAEKGVMIAEGQALVRRCLRLNQPGPYQIQAAINAVHSDAPSAEATDWRQIVQLYDQLLALTPTSIVALNRAVAVAEIAGPAAALALVESLDLDGYYLFHAIRADLLRRLGRSTDAAAAYDLAVARTDNAAERAFLQRRRASASR